MGGRKKHNGKPVTIMDSGLRICDGANLAAYVRRNERIQYFGMGSANDYYPAFFRYLFYYPFAFSTKIHLAGDETVG